jgi:hypothetical protein
MCPDRRSASTNVPYNQTTRMGTAMRVEPPASAVPHLGVDGIARQMKRHKQD